jgi:hypothetical protein
MHQQRIATRTRLHTTRCPRRRRRPPLRGLLAVLPAVLCACAAPSANSIKTAPAPDPVNAAQPHEVLDEQSGVTLIVVQRPILFARARTDVAVNARDYLTLVAVEEDRSGKYTGWLIAHQWSTVDPRMEDGMATVRSRLHIIADDRELSFTRAEPDPLILARGDLLFAPRGARARSAAFAVDDATLRFIAASSHLMLRIGDDALAPAYGVWEDGREALQGLLAEVGQPRSAGR